MSVLVSSHVLTDICWISFLELGIGKALVMHVYPAWFLCNGNGTNISSYNPYKNEWRKNNQT